MPAITSATATATATATSTTTSATATPNTSTRSNNSNNNGSRRRHPLRYRVHHFSRGHQRARYPHSREDCKACCRSASICASFFAMIWCVNMLVSAVSSLSWVHQYFDNWESAEALIIGINDTNSHNNSNSSITNNNNTDFYVGKNHDDQSNSIFCAIFNFETKDQENVTTVSDTVCSRKAESIPVGTTLSILYNPDFPEEVIEEDIYSFGGDSLRMTVGVTVFFAVFYLVCGVYLFRVHLNMTSMVRGGSNFNGEYDEEHGEDECSEERTARIISKFHFQTVADDKSNTTATSLRHGADPQTEKTVDSTDDDIENAKNEKDDNEDEALTIAKMGNLKDGDDLNAIDPEIPPADTPTTTTSSKNDDHHDDASNNDESGSLALGTGAAAVAAAADTTKKNSLVSSASISSTSSWWSNGANTSKDDECCICMETYQPGESICVAKTAECDHVFHKDCITSWLQHQNHDCCPLCRVDLMK
eukprot:scaffold1786_cov138-Cylindrotheca_fusiformis.AAC.18